MLVFCALFQLVASIRPSHEAFLQTSATAVKVSSGWPKDLVVDSPVIPLGAGVQGLTIKAKLKGKPVALKLFVPLMGNDDHAEWEQEVHAFSLVQKCSYVMHAKLAFKGVRLDHLPPDYKTWLVEGPSGSGDVETTRLRHKKFLEGIPDTPVSGIVMDLMDGGSWQSNMDKLGDKEIYQIAKHIAKALKCLHEKKLQHTDVKPDNLMVRNSKGGLFQSDSDHAHEGYVIDLGSVRTVREVQGLCETGNLVGMSAQYVPYNDQPRGPEECQKLADRQDMFAFAKVLQEAGFPENESVPLLTEMLDLNAKAPTWKYVVEELTKGYKNVGKSDEKQAQPWKLDHRKLDRPGN